MIRPSVWLVLIALAGTAACERESTTPSATVDPSQLPTDDVIYGLNHIMTKKGVRSAVLDGDTAYLREAGQRFDLSGVHLKFYAESGQETGTLTSREGEYDLRTGSFVARGDVVLVTGGPQGERTISTEELYYEVSSDQLWSDKPFVLKEAGRTTRGSSFRSDSKFQTWTVTNAETAGGLPKSEDGISF